MVRVDRRDFLRSSAAATAGTALLAGCLTEDDGEVEEEEDFPSDTITMIVPFGEGGGTDLFARAIGDQMDEFLGESITYENEGGAGGVTGTGQAHSATPDGYTMVAFNPPSTPTSWLVQEPDYDISELEGVASIGGFPYIIYANSDYEIDGFDDLVDRYEDGEFTDIAGQGQGTMVDVVARVLRDDVGLEWDEYIAYDGGDEVTSSVMGDEVAVGIGTDTGAESGAEDGRLDPIACIPSDGSGVFPDLETIAEQGYAEEGDDIDTLAMLEVCYWVPPETPESHIEALADATEQAIETDEVQQFGEDSGNVVEFSGPEEVNEIMEDVLETVPEAVDLDAIREDAD
jgi:tripartite-type tricarboxylate transporter receptor subunit TctC